MKLKVYGYGQIVHGPFGRKDYRYIGQFRSAKAFIDALMKIGEISRFASRGWIYERLSVTGNVEEIKIASEHPNEIFRYEKDPAKVELMRLLK